MTTRRPFTIVLGGGGARGFAHVGVLRALERERLRPSGIVGVSLVGRVTSPEDPTPRNLGTPNEERATGIRSESWGEKP